MQSTKRTRRSTAACQGCDWYVETGDSATYREVRQQGFSHSKECGPVRVRTTRTEVDEFKIVRGEMV